MPGTTASLLKAVKPADSASTTSEITPTPAEIKLTPPSQTTNLKLKKVVTSCQFGAIGMITQAIPVNMFNQMSIVACQWNCSTMGAMTRIYNGQIYGKTPSLKNFGRGLKDHVRKEIPRIPTKAVWLANKQEWFGDSHLKFSVSLAATEIFVQPFHVWRSSHQAGIPLPKTVAGCMNGVIPNVLRQTVIWGVYSLSDQQISKRLEKYTDINPYSLTGIALKGVPQSVCFTAPSYPLERFANEVINHPDKYANLKPGQFKYVEAGLNIVRTQGFLGFVRGGAAKTAGNAVLAMGSNVLVELGRGENAFKRR